MIYAIRALSTDFIKFGIARNALHRLKSLQVGCPLDLAIAAVADWPDAEEAKIHHYLTMSGKHVRGEWFRKSPQTDWIIDAMLLETGSLETWHGILSNVGGHNRRLARVINLAVSNG